MNEPIPQIVLEYSENIKEHLEFVKYFKEKVFVNTLINPL